ncbi:MAG: hypothetical protein GY750_10840 [Lentisphaerae bacterium]|nr:hypothetical protein [Lentisphaerota bacterium]MCP4101907.1 hypothetical protein [Lentisphaerota bacterium]
MHNLNVRWDKIILFHVRTEEYNDSHFNKQGNIDCGNSRHARNLREGCPFLPYIYTLNQMGGKFAMHLRRVGAGGHSDNKYSVDGYHIYVDLKHKRFFVFSDYDIRRGTPLFTKYNGDRVDSYVTKCQANIV